MTDVVPARANYAKLDDRSRRAHSPEQHGGAGEACGRRDERRRKWKWLMHAAARSTPRERRTAILACWNMVIPYICEELPEKQQEALASAQKVPLLYTNVVLRNWTSFQKLGANAVYAPGMLPHACQPRPAGEHRRVSSAPRKPEEPIVVHMMKTPCQPGVLRGSSTAPGRIELYSTTFETMERKIREQLARTLGPEASIPRATSRRSQ